MRTTALLIGTRDLCQRLEHQLAALNDPPVVVGWVVPATSTEHHLSNAESEVLSSVNSKINSPILGSLRDLESIIARRKPGVALVSLPAAMRDLIATTRTRLRKLGVPDRFMPTMEDQIAGIGPRSQLDIDYSLLIDRPPKQMDAEAVREVIDGKRVCITGAGGSIGSELARIVSQFDPEQVQLIERSENALFEVDRQLAQKRPELPRRAVLHDVVDAEGTLQWFDELQPQIIFHTAAHKHVPMMENHPAAAVDNNLFGTKSVADAADVIGAERFVLISTDKAVNPVSVMGATKRLAELYVQYLHRQSVTGFSTVRFGNVLASSGSVLEIWSRQIAEGGPVTVTDPRMTRYFMTIPEAAALVIQSAALLDEGVDDGEVFLLDMGDPIRIVDLAMRFVEQHGLVAQLPDTPELAATPGMLPIVYAGIRPGEKLHEDLAFDAESMRPTRHPDINIWTLTPPHDRYVEMMIESLSPHERPGDPTELIDAIRKLLVDPVAMAAA